MTTVWPSRARSALIMMKNCRLAKIAEAIKAEGSKAILQIYHGGRMVDPQLIGAPAGGAERYCRAA